jgi:hypothetical protein
MPKLRRRRVCWRVSWVVVQAARRDSRGCVDVVVVEEEGVLREARSVSGRPGAEGAEGWDFELGVLVLVVVFVVLVGWEGWGVMRRDWVVSIGYWGLRLGRCTMMGGL